MDPAESRFIRKVFIKERGAEVFKKSARPPSWEGPSAVNNSQRGNEIHRTVGIGGTCVGFLDIYHF
jgi:hypothetical protein